MGATTNSYRDVVCEFARTGAEIIRLDPAVHYEQIGRGARRPLEPGFVPINRRPLLTAISYYPNESDLPSVEYAVAREAFRQWGATGSYDDYCTAYRLWQTFREQIPFYRRWELPLFAELGLESYETAWLPLVKCPLPAKTKIDRDSIDISRDMHLLWGQLTVLRPEIVLVQGAIVCEILGKRLDNLKFIETHAVQKIPQQASTGVMREQLERLTRELRPRIDVLRKKRAEAEK